MLSVAFPRKNKTGRIVTTETLNLIFSLLKVFIFLQFLTASPVVDINDEDASP